MGLRELHKPTIVRRKKPDSLKVSVHEIIKVKEALKSIVSSGSIRAVLPVVPIASKGEPGKSAYEIAVSKGFSGTEEEWSESLGGFSEYVGNIDGGRADSVYGGIENIDGGTS